MKSCNRPDKVEPEAWMHAVRHANPDAGAIVGFEYNIYIIESKDDAIALLNILDFQYNAIKAFLL